MTTRKNHGSRTGGLVGVAIVTGVLALTTAFAPQAFADGPEIKDFTFEPDTFRLGENTTMSFSYCNVAGGLHRATLSLTYQGSAAGQSRKVSDWQALISGDREPCGTFRATFRPSPSDAPPFDILYVLSIVDENGNRSNVAEATLRYQVGSPKVEARKAEDTVHLVAEKSQALARTLEEMSPWSGTWHTTRGTRYNGTLELVFTYTPEQGIKGRVQRSTGTSQSFDGPVYDLTLSENGEVSFVVVSGAKYELELDSAKKTLTGFARDGLAAINLKSRKK